MSVRPVRVAVVVPARDEETLVGACLTALAAAGARLLSTHPDITLDLVVVLDRCTDRTEEIVRAAGIEPLVVDHGSVGAARADGAAVAVRRSRAAGVHDASLWLASTDADSVVPPHWLLTQVELAGGSDAVFGTVEPGGDADPAVLAEWHRRHDLREEHPYVHGANLGVRASTYLAAGGYPHLPAHEDVALAAALRAHTDRWVATDRMRVRSSARPLGRCEGGFAAYLSDLSELPDLAAEA